jgi:3-hydroxyisobutyrate dehydrogenase-like beta-hydroxyacid dehydrogenase
MTTEKTSTVGVFGAGRMGLPIVGHLVKKGFDALVFDVDASKEAAVTERGARFSADRNLVGRVSDTLLVCVGYEEQLNDMMYGPGNVLDELREGALIAVLSTVSPDGMKALAEAAAKRGVDVVDAPVCRGRFAADAGELLTLLGGTEEATTRFSEVASAYASDIVRLGDIGCGQVGKAVNNLILWACLVGDHEALALAHRHDVDIDLLRQALSMSSANNGALGNWNQQSMAWAEDDLKIISEMAVNVGISLPQAALNREICRVLKPRRYDLDKYGL